MSAPGWMPRTRIPGQQRGVPGGEQGAVGARLRRGVRLDLGKVQLPVFGPINPGLHGAELGERGGAQVVQRLDRPIGHVER